MPTQTTVKGTPTPKKSTFLRRVLWTLGCGAVLAAAAIVFSFLFIKNSSADAIVHNIEQVPKQKVTLVLGCAPRLKSGAPNLFFQNRIYAAADLYHAGKTEYILVSGDNSRKNYDEPTAMKTALVRLGIPSEKILIDYAGFSTLDSIARAKDVFEIKTLCIVTQQEHAYRAVFIARSYDLDVVAFTARDVSTTYGLRTQAREALARLRTILDVTLLQREPRYLGDNPYASQLASGTPES